MNYYKQVAEMLGVRLNEKFMLKGTDNRIRPRIYKITDKGLFYEFDGKWLEGYNLFAIFQGDLTILKLPWKPKADEFYYYYSPYAGITCQERCTNTSSDYCMWKLGNCFGTREEAETKGKEIMEKIEKEYIES